MTIKTARLLEIVSAHGYLAGARSPALVFSATSDTLARLARQRMLFRRTPGGCVVLVEVDSDSSTPDPIVPIPRDLRLDFAVGVVDADFHVFSALPDSGPRVQILSNRRASTNADGPMLHPGNAIGPDTAGLLGGSILKIDLPVTTAESFIEIVDENSVTIASQRVVATGGRASATFDLSRLEPLPVQVRVDGVVALRAFIDSSLSRQAPFGVASITMRADNNDETSCIGSDGRPLDTLLRLVIDARSTIWRYTIVTRNDPALDESSLAVEDIPPDGATLPLTFSPIGPKAPLPNGEPAVIFESTSVVPLLAQPRLGLRLSRVIASHSREPILNNLPNPRPGALSPASTAARAISEVFLYV